MMDSLEKVNAQLDGMGERLHAIEERLARLEEVVHATVPKPEPELGPELGPEPELELEQKAAETDAGVRDPELAQGDDGERAAQPEDDLFGNLPALAGRTAIVLSVAFLLRALTEGGTLLPPLGVALGLVYATSLYLAAHRAFLAGTTASATVHGASAAMVGFPLVWEATTRMGVLAAGAAATALVALTMLGLALSWRHRAGGLAWITTLFSVPTIIVLLFKTDLVLTYGAALVAVSIGTYWLARQHGWPGLPWASAFPLNGALLALALLAGRSDGLGGVGAGTAIVLMLSALTVFLISFAGRVCVLRSEASLFALFQTILLLVSAVGGALWVALRTHVGVAGVASVLLLMALLDYALLVGVVERRESPSTFQTRLTLGVPGAALFIASTGVLLPAPVAATIWAVLAMVAAWRGLHRGDMNDQVQGVVYAFAAGIHGGVLTHGLDTLFRTGEPWRTPTVAGSMLAFACLAAYGATLRPQGDAQWDPRRFAPASLLAVGLMGLASVCVTALASATIVISPPTQDPGALAAVRTAVIAGAALILAALARWHGRCEHFWLMKVAIAFGALKVFVHDMPSGRPATLTVSLACLGIVLIVAPRLAGKAPGKGRKRGEAATLG